MASLNSPTSTSSSEAEAEAEAEADAKSSNHRFEYVCFQQTKTVSNVLAGTPKQSLGSPNLNLLIRYSAIYSDKDFDYRHVTVPPSFVSKLTS